MNRNALYAVLILAGAGGAYWYYNRSKTSTKDQVALQDQTAATAAQQYYTQPPANPSAQVSAGGRVFLNNSQAMPLPYNV